MMFVVPEVLSALSTMPNAGTASVLPSASGTSTDPPNTPTARPDNASGVSPRLVAPSWEAMNPTGSSVGEDGTWAASPNWNWSSDDSSMITTSTNTWRRSTSSFLMTPSTT